MNKLFSNTQTLSTQQVLALSETELVAKLKKMQTSELEIHAENIMKEMGSSDYSKVMAQIMKVVKADEKNTTPFKNVQKALEDLLPNKAYFSDIYERLAAIVMTIIARRFKDLL